MVFVRRLLFRFSSWRPSYWMLAGLCLPVMLTLPSTASAATSEGGPVMTAPTIYPIYWGSRWKVGPAASVARLQMQGLMNSFSNSSWEGILTQYWGSNGFPSHSVVRAPYYIDTHSGEVPTGLTKAGVASEVSAAIAANAEAGWPQSPTINDLFVVFTPQGTTWAEEAHFCGYHNGGNGNYPIALVSWEEQGSPGECGHTLVLSHEFAEAVTDPYPPTSWSRSEIADACQTEHSTLNGYEVTKLYDNYLGGCREADSYPAQLAPEEIADEPAEVTSTSATLEGHAVPHGVDIKWYWFEWGSLSVSEHKTARSEFFPRREPWSASAAISGLTSGKHYKFRLVVEDAEFFNTQTGSVREFVTP